MTAPLEYPFATRPLTNEEGGGFLIEFPDLPGCMSDGETIEEAIENGKEALRSMLHAYEAQGKTPPLPGSSLKLEQYSGRILQRVPRSIHQRLHQRAEQEGISVNSLVLSYISQGLGHPADRPPE